MYTRFYKLGLFSFLLVLIGLISLPKSFANNTNNILKINNLQINVEIADTESKRRQGLMHRTELGADSGMLFVFPDSEIQCFWMKNTLLPLSIAFINSNNKITDIYDMEPQTLNGHCSSEQINQALEVNQGWFQQNNIKVGDLVEIK